MANSALSLHGPIGIQDNRNELINGDFNVWQRGILVDIPMNTIAGRDGGASTGNKYVADRWRIYLDAKSNGVTAPQMQITRKKMPLGFPPGANRASKWYLNIHVGPTASTGGADSGHNNVGGFTGAGATTDGSFAALVQDIDDVGTLEGKTCILSFWAKSDITNQRVAPVLKQCFAGGTLSTLLISGSTGHLGHTLDNTWRQYKTSFNVPSIEGQPLDAGGGLEFGSSGDDALQVQLILHANSGKAGTGVTFELGGPLEVGRTGNISFSQIQIEQGSRTTEFDKTNPEQEVSRCQRYYEKSYNLDTTPGTVTQIINDAGPGIVRQNVQLAPVYGLLGNESKSTGVHFMCHKRTVPTIQIWSCRGVLGKASTSDFDVTIAATGIGQSGFHTGSRTNVGWNFFYYTADAELSVDTD